MLFTEYEEDKYYLVGGRCQLCRTYMFPLKWMCPSCNSKKIEKVHLSSAGIVYTHTVIQVHPPEGFSLPYAVGYVWLKKEKIVVPALFAGDEEQILSIKIGDQVELKPNEAGHKADYVFQISNKS